MALLRSAVAGCADGASAVVEITGDPGLGKTRMLAELGALARAEGLVTLTGRASEFERRRVSGAFTGPGRCADGLADDQGTSWGSAPDRPPTGAWDNEIGALLNVVLGRGAGAHAVLPPSSGGERDPLRHAVSGALTAAGRGRGMLLCLDDLHWADDGTLDLLHHVLRQPPPAPLVLACGYRLRQAQPKLIASLRAAAARYRTVSVPLAPLERQSCDALLGTGLLPAEKDRLYTAGGGNPFYLEVLSELAAAGTGPDGFSGLPVALRATLARDCALLTDEQLCVLRAAAVLGDPFDPLLLAPVAALPSPAALGALDGLATRDLVRCVSTPGQRGQREDARQLLRFRHPLMREVVSWETPPGWRLAANRRADHALRRSGAGPVERAPYVARSARVGDGEAVRVLSEAATLTLHAAPSMAGQWLRTALDLCATRRNGDTARERLGLLLGLARASGMTGDLAASRDALARALELVPDDRPDQRIPIAALRAVVERVLGSPRAAGRVLEGELAHWSAEDPRPDPLRMQLATVGMALGRYVEADAQLGTLLARSPAPVDPRTRTAVAACRALGAAHRGRTAALRSCATEAASSIDAMGDMELETFLDEVGQLGLAELLAGRHDDAVRHLGRGVRVARRTGQTFVLPHLLVHRAHAQLASGDLDGALASAADAEETARMIERPEFAGHALALRAALTAVRCGPTAAIPEAEQAVGTVGRCGRMWELSVSVLAPLRLDQNRPDECLELLRTLVAADVPPPTYTLRPMWWALAARAAAATGDLR
ncbi:AAA family ATPase, partial [Streptomyces sp. NPDC059828]|uniref:AAA family ATPase n=1 Tax=Streptomyces sp. NPDC059828 TaxID=3346965 RepID=UPI0036595415